MKTVKDVLEQINSCSPFSAALDWDNVGLLVGDESLEVRRIHVALDATDEAIEHAISLKSDLLVTHHPMIFSQVKNVRASDFTGRRIISLIQNRMSYIAMHTNYDIFGMADLAAGKLGLLGAVPLERVEVEEYPASYTGRREAGIGRVGRLEKAVSLKDLAKKVKEAFGALDVRFFGDKDKNICRAAICPGSGKSVIPLALKEGADVLITGDIDHHSGIDAVAAGLSIIDAGHYGIEHIFIADAASKLREAFKGEVEVSEEPIAEPIYLVQ